MTHEPPPKLVPTTNLASPSKQAAPQGLDPTAKLAAASDSAPLGLERELPALRALVAKLAPAGDVDDLVQEVVSRALRYRDTFDGRRALGPWLAKTALNVCVDHRARRARETTSHEPLEPAAAPDTRVEEREHVAVLLAKLSRVERDVLVRFHQCGESVREIAAALGLAEGTVKSHLCRARKRLAEERP
ncbi:MAG: sigma-70 family RNA polymerase sigma factor [Planctomycetes bacterium]|nr:sigma-70 family RNA polymerase sigma factor [Planctomycetota bacterium]